jgi:hypothetical protein
MKIGAMHNEVLPAPASDSVVDLNSSDVVPGGGRANMINVHSAGVLDHVYLLGLDKLALLLSSKCHDCCISYSS